MLTPLRLAEEVVVKEQQLPWPGIAAPDLSHSVLRPHAAL